MDHIVFMDDEPGLGQLLDGSSTVLTRKAVGRKQPFFKVNAGDMVYFVTGGQTGFAVGRAIVKTAASTERPGCKTAAELVCAYKEKLGLNPVELKKISARKHLLLVEFGMAEKIRPFPVSIAGLGLTRANSWISVACLKQIRVA